MEEFNILSLLIILAGAWLGGTSAKRLGYPPILGELVIGIILGPALLGLLETSEMISVLAEVGIILLMVYIGIEINFRDLGKASWPGLLAAIGGFIVPFGMGYYTIIFFGGTDLAALFVAIAVGVTSLATKSRILVDLKLLNTRIAYVLMAGALISDTLALVIFAGMLSFVDVGSIDTLGLVWVAGKAILFFAFTALSGYFLLPLLGRLLSENNIKNRTFHFTLILIIVFGFCELAELAGLHSILGAFMAGLFIRDGVFNRQISKEINDIFHDISIGFLAPIFFVSAGFHVTLEVFQTNLLMLITVVLVAMVGKIVGTALFYLPSGYGWREGVTVGTGMNGRGAVEIIIAGIGLEMGIISTEIFSILVFMAIFTTLSVPVFLTWTTNWLRKRGELIHQESRKGILILGANPLGLYLAGHIKDQEEITFVDSNRELVEEARQRGFESVHGNILKEETMETARAFEKGSFIALTGNNEINLLAAQLAHDAFFIPKNIVLFAPQDEGAGVEVLDRIKASSMFASKTELGPWIFKIKSGDYSEDTEEVKQVTTTRNWVKKHKSGKGKILPVLIIDPEGHKRPFHYHDEIQPEEKVLFLH
ncbi:Kef-type K+ transport system, membrane component KefB [Salinimicrobium catena]|uniref:Kef-type K+ transport system, membrane component KefB n=1 Tax=Salinimicrobium catena TaxID=390640 RepID=A0A1H5ILG9_9FLAO|nr:cation:proton antiporter [Salinimicrobium catena]SDK78666.1 Kef-type K+ transport system, membrane component KefB [Salinimicrobium catena]SEE41052.1 Kef-type K+ transport system, membrane component KefB [Salinimicrobium catena]